MDIHKQIFTPEASRRLFWWFIDAFLIVLIIASLNLSRMLRRDADAERTIVVSGEGRAVVIPDIARLSFTVVNEGSEPAALQAENSRAMNAAIEFIKGEGVPAKDIETSGYHLSPRYDYDRFTGRSAIYGYTLTQTVTAKIREFGKISRIVGSLPAKGINQIESLTFDVDDPERHLNEARREAFSEARAKAQAMASYAGVRLGRIVTFSEGGGNVPPPRVFALGEAQRISDAPLPAVEPGSRELAVGITVTYEIR